MDKKIYLTILTTSILHFASCCVIFTYSFNNNSLLIKIAGTYIFLVGFVLAVGVAALNLLNEEDLKK